METLIRLLVEEVVKLASAYSWLATSNRTDKIGHPLLSSFPILLRSSSLIPSLAADAQEATRPADGQSGNAFLREDLPGRFFTDTP